MVTINILVDVSVLICKYMHLPYQNGVVLCRLHLFLLDYLSVMCY